jgi:two-component system, cell cycle sensor histidine kinase and response regulator CckA
LVGAIRIGGLIQTDKVKMKNKRLFLLLVSLLALCAFLFTFFYQEAKREAIDNLNIQQSLLARQAARGIEDFFTHWTGILTIFAKSRHIIDLDQAGTETIENFYQANREQIRGITRIDAAGRIIYTIPYDRRLIGRDISDQNHVREVMRIRKTVVSDVFTAVQGYRTVALHVPVFGNGIYQGTIAVTVDFQSLARRYLEVIKIRKTGYAWVTSRDGTELYCPVPGHIGKSVFETCKDFPSALAMAKEMLQGHQGVTTYTFDQIRGQAVKTIKKHAVYMPINLGNTFWSIVVATSEDEVLVTLADFRNRLILVMALFLLGAALFSYYSLKARFIIKEEEKRLKAEAALKESEEKFRKAFYTSPDSININRLADGMYVSINEGFSRITGYSEADTIGRTSVELNIWANPEDRRKLVAGLKTAGEVNNLDAAFRMKNGQIRYGLMSAAMIDLQGTPHILSITRDITDRRQEEERLRESTELVSAIFEHVQAGIFLIDSATHTIVNANRMAVEMCGTAKEELIGKTCHKYICPAAAGNCPITDCGQSIDRAERVLLTTDGREIPVLKTAVPVRIAERDYLLESFIDMTEGKRLASQLLQAQKMEAVGTLAGGIAHDFNNILMGIQGVASLMMLDFDPAQPQHERLKMIEDQVKRGADLTRQLLGFARGGRYEVKPTNINEIINKSSSMFGRTRKEIAIHRKYEKEIWTLEVDQGQMEQVFLNLYVNAGQAMPGGGSIYLETQNVVLDEFDSLPDLNKPGRYVKISVSDTGMGMDEKTRERIFDPFFTTKGIGRGTGLGLAMVYGIIKGHGGGIQVYSEPGQGTTFHIHLPASEKSIAEEKAFSGKIFMGTETILLVDDEKMVLDVSMEMLESLGYRVFSAGSGQEAIAVYMEKKGRIDLVILDMIMPGISGGETFDRLREICPGIVVLLSSGYSVNGQAQEILDRGCRGFLQKPFTLEILSKKIREVLNP